MITGVEKWLIGPVNILISLGYMSMTFSGNNSVEIKGVILEYDNLYLFIERHDRAIGDIWSVNIETRLSTYNFFELNSTKDIKYFLNPIVYTQHDWDVDCKNITATFTYTFITAVM